MLTAAAHGLPRTDLESVALRAAYTGRISGLADMLTEQGGGGQDVVRESVARLRAALAPMGQLQNLEHRWGTRLVARPVLRLVAAEGVGAKLPNLEPLKT